MPRKLLKDASFDVDRNTTMLMSSSDQQLYFTHLYRFISYSFICFCSLLVLPHHVKTKLCVSRITNMVPLNVSVEKASQESSGKMVDSRHNCCLIIIIINFSTGWIMINNQS